MFCVASVLLGGRHCPGLHRRATRFVRLELVCSFGDGAKAARCCKGALSPTGSLGTGARHQTWCQLTLPSIPLEGGHENILGKKKTRKRLKDNSAKQRRAGNVVKDEPIEHQVPVKPWMALVAVFILAKLMGAFVPPSACQAMDGAGRCLHFGEVDGSLCATVKKDLRPRLTQSRAWEVKVWQVIVFASSLVVATIQAVRAVRGSKRAFRTFPEGKIQAAVAKAMGPFEPTRAQDEVIKRPVMDTIKNRIKSWRQHATIIGGRFQSGKSVAVEEAWRGVRGVVRSTINSADWYKMMCKQEKLDNIGLFKEVMCRAREKPKDFPDNLTKYPILLLEIPRTTTEGLSGQKHLLFLSVV
eukprot:s597_g33.t1